MAEIDFEKQIVGVMEILNLSRVEAIRFLKAVKTHREDPPDRMQILEQLEKEALDLEVRRQSTELNGGEGI